MFSDLKIVSLGHNRNGHVIENGCDGLVLTLYLAGIYLCLVELIVYFDYNRVVIVYMEQNLLVPLWIK